MIKLVKTRLGMRHALVAIAILATAALSTPVHAFGLTGFGGKLGYTSPENLDGTAMVGVHAEFEQPDSRLHLLPSIMYWNSNDVRDLSANFDAYYHFSSEGLVTPYVGAGLGMNFFNNERIDRGNTELGLNLMGGLRFPGPSSHYFLEGRYTASDIDQFALLGGITFHTH